MKFAFFSDVHGDMAALNAVLRDIKTQNIKRCFFLGDAIDLGRDSDACVKRICEETEIQIMGNHDAEALNDIPAFVRAETAENLTPESIKLISGFRRSATVDDFFLTHSNPAEPDKHLYLESLPNIQKMFDSFGEKICIIGHNHRSLAFVQRANGEIEFLGFQEFGARIQEDCRYFIGIPPVSAARDGVSLPRYLIYNSEGVEGFVRDARPTISTIRTPLFSPSLDFQPEFVRSFI